MTYRFVLEKLVLSGSHDLHRLRIGHPRLHKVAARGSGRRQVGCRGGRDLGDFTWYVTFSLYVQFGLGARLFFRYLWSRIVPFWSLLQRLCAAFALLCSFIVNLAAGMSYSKFLIMILPQAAVTTLTKVWSANWVRWAFIWALRNHPKLGRTKSR